MRSELSRLRASLKSTESRLAIAVGALEKAANGLDEAADEIGSWGAYAGEYFQEKHDLAGSVAETKNAANFARTALSQVRSKP